MNHERIAAGIGRIRRHIVDSNERRRHLNGNGPPKVPPELVLVEIAATALDALPALELMAPDAPETRNMRTALENAGRLSSHR